MALNKDSKKKIIEDLIEELKNYKGIVLTDYQGMNVVQISSLREALKEKQVSFKIVKNTLMKIASERLEIENLSNDLAGCTAVAFSKEDSIAPAKLLQEYSKKNKFEIKIKSGLIEGRLLSPEQVVEIASLPSKDILIVQIVSGIKYPLYHLVFVLQGPLRGLIYTLEAIKRQKEAKAS